MLIDKIKKIIPSFLRVYLRRLSKLVKYRLRYFIIRQAATKDNHINLILGAAETSQKGWYSTNYEWFDISKSNDWDRIFNGKVIVKKMVAEHVFEHLTADQMSAALSLAHQHLIPGGKLRIAVPDGYNPDPTYRAHVDVGGIGADASDHKQLLNYDILREALIHAGFQSTLLEGYSSSGELVSNAICEQDGFILRSRANPKEIKAQGWDFPNSKTSLIIDAIKLTKLPS